VLGKTAKVLSILVALTMVLGFFAVLAPESAAEVADTPKVADPEAIDIGSEVRQRPVDAKAVQASLSDETLDKSVFADYYDVGDLQDFYDVYVGDWVEFEKRGEGDYCEVWVGADLSFPEGDDRNDEPWKFNITEDHVNYIIEQFDEVIYPTEAEYFGEPDNHTGDNGLFEDWGLPYFQNVNGQKVMIMIFNIMDENYWNSNYPYYVVGYYSTTTEIYYDRNVIHIDCWDWDNRTTGSAPRPYLYEGVVAHEYQHLLHDDADPEEETWLNEGLSMYAEFLCNYSSVWDNVYRFLYTPDNGLVDWGDQGDINILADYGVAMLYMVYLNDHFGGADFISDLFHSTAHGAESINEVLEANHFDWTFDDVFYAFRLANLLHTDDIGDGWYNYESISWSDPDAMELYDGSIPYFDADGYADSAADYFGHTYTYDFDDETGMRYDTRMANVGSYGTDYFYTYAWDYGLIEGLKFFLNGDDEIAEGWEMVAKDVLWEYGFDSGDLAADGWSLSTSGQPWTITEWSGGQNAAWCDGSNVSGAVNSYLTMNTISIDASEASQLELQFYLDFYDYSGSDQFSVQVNYGSGWYNYGTWYSSEQGMQTIDLSGLAGEDDIKLRFYYYGPSGTYGYALVDDISVYDPSDMCWYSGAADEIDYKLIGSVDLTDTRNATLTFDTWYQIEELWDFGFVQVSTDGGDTWTSLANEYTTEDYDPSAYPTVVENVPGLTGSSDGWMSMSFNLSEYSGLEILISFRYVTDWATTESGWYVDNVCVDGEEVAALVPEYMNTDFMVTIYCPAYGNMPALIFDLNMNHITEETLRSFHSVAEYYNVVYILVTPTQGMADYQFWFTGSGMIL
jgi:hypothetical protein